MTTPSESSPTRRPRVVFVGASDFRGGAARAMMRLYSAIQKYESHRIDLHVRVTEKSVPDNRVIGGRPQRSWWQQLRYFLITRYRKRFPRPEFVSPNSTYRSQCLHPSGLGRELNGGHWDLAVLHWLGDKTMSIEEIGALRIPYAWHLHDMWLFSGADHMSTDRRYSVGYSRNSRPAGESGPDINREVFLRKLKCWEGERALYSPSHWLAVETQQSPLTVGWPTVVVPNPLDTDFWIPLDEEEHRKKWGLSSESVVILFGASTGANDLRKGPDVLFDALRSLAAGLEAEPAGPNIQLLLFGKPGGVPNDLPYPTTHLGPIDDTTLRAAYAAASIVVVPSRVEPFGQVASEAQSCGRAVVASDVGGLSDIIEHGETGLLVEPGVSASLSRALLKLVGDRGMRERLGNAARKRAEALWSERAVAHHYASALVAEIAKNRNLPV